MSFPMDPGALGGMMAGLQRRMDEARAEAEAQEVTGQSGGGLVKVTATGALEIVRVQIDPKAAADPELLEDLIAVATNDALRRAKGALEASMQGVLGGLPLPPGLL
jgi:DNA-binding YbaB/EbfC family protein